MSFAYWLSQKENLQRMYYEGEMSTTEIASYYKVDNSTISNNMRRMGFILRKVKAGSRANAKYNVDTTYFDNIDSGEKAYVVGYICSDGHVSKQDTLMFGLAKNDKQVLEMINASMKSDYPIFDYKDRYSGLNIHDTVLCQRLREIGITNNKSKLYDFEKVVNSIPHEFINDFIRGLFDGDGSICIYYYPYFNKPTYHFGFTGILKSVSFVHNYFDLGTKIVDEGNGIYTCVSSHTKKIIEAGHLMYDEASIYIPRKRETFERIYQLNF